MESGQRWGKHLLFYDGVSDPLKSAGSCDAVGHASALTDLVDRIENRIEIPRQELSGQARLSRSEEVTVWHRREK